MKVSNVSMRLCFQMRGKLLLANVRLINEAILESKTDVLIFLTNKRLLAGTIYIRFLIYLKAIQGQKWKKSTIQLLPWNQDFAGFFLTIALKQLSKQNSTNRSPVLSMVLQLCQPIASSFLVISSLTLAFKSLVINIMSRCGTLETAVAVAHKSHHCPLPLPHS